jgi:hypothetical protein
LGGKIPVGISRPIPGAASSLLGAAWKVWVRNLADVLQKRRFRTGVRKDLDKSNTTSPFVVFTRELQKLIPPSFRRGSHSDVALATLISKAIRGR